MLLPIVINPKVLPLFRRCIALLSVLTLMVLPYQSFAEWQVLENIPNGRTHFSVEAVNNEIYVVGGSPSSSGSSASVEVDVYDTVTQTWSTGPSMPTARQRTASGVINGQLYIAGGANNSNSMIGELTALDIATGVWSARTSMPDGGRAWAVGGVLNGKLYVIGGLDQQGPSLANVGTTSIYDPNSDSWSEGSPMPTPRRGSAGAVLNGEIYVVGGYGEGQLAIVEAYNPLTDQWTTKASLPSPRWYPSAAAVDGKLYVIGGTDNNDQRVDIYDPSTNSWTAGPDLAVSHGWGSAATSIGSTVYVLGGNLGLTAFESQELRPLPIAYAGVDVEVDVGENVLLDGVNSTDSQDHNYQLSYQWSLVEAPQGSTSSISSATSRAVHFIPDLPGTYRIALQVTNTAGSISAPDEVELLAGLNPGYIYKKLDQGSYSFERNGDSYNHQYDYPIVLGVSDEDVLLYRNVYSYDSATQLSQSSSYFYLTDGDIVKAQLNRGQAIDTTKKLGWFNAIGKSNDGGYFFEGNIEEELDTGRKIINRGLLKLGTDGAITQELSFPLALPSGDTISGWNILTNGQQSVFVSILQPYSYKSYQAANGYRYNYPNYGVYFVQNGNTRLLWDTTRPLPGTNIVPYNISLRSLSDTGQVAILAGGPNLSADCPNCWYQALLLVTPDIDGNYTAQTILTNREGSEYFGYYLNSIRFDSESLWYSVTGYRDYPNYSGYEQLLQVYEGNSNTTVFKGPQYTQGTYFNLYHFDVLYGNWISHSYPNIAAFFDGRLRIVARQGQELDAITPQYLSLGLYNNQSALSNHTVAFRGQTQTSFAYNSNQDYSYSYAYFAFWAKQDSDRDNLDDLNDNCPLRPNPDQIDTDLNGIGDVCEDSDIDGVPDIDDNCPLIANSTQLDSDGDSFGNACDSCPFIVDNQSDRDGDHIGDACDLDNDNDGLTDDLDNCPLAANSNQLDLDSDLVGDICDNDKDGDGIANLIDGTYTNEVFFDESEVASLNFTDEALGGTTFGSLVANSDKLGWVVEDDASEGVVITSRSTAKLKACGDQKPVTWVGGAASTLTCGSVSVRPLFGILEVAMDTSETFKVTVTEGAALKVVDNQQGEVTLLVSPDSATPITATVGSDIELELVGESAVIVEKYGEEQYEITNSATSIGTVTATVDGQVYDLKPGDKGYPVLIDIKPGSEDNSINLGSNGVVPVVILSSVSFDATSIDPLSVTLANAAAKLKGKGTPQYSLIDINDDGLTDMEVMIETSALELTSESQTATLNASTSSGMQLIGMDTVQIVRE
ncbi:thrombospondin type 3 repeat-containing protein [Vibrio sp. EJY3]|uniref:Kelch repeat-containing protein n=1 Tax=Vibrio sp. (strain EJY3) TaxID=1116375 RepID=UPI0002E24D51|nr:thrombospondin type 3 repeat-containing protein [Vibrio sp. EJY3]